MKFSGESEILGLGGVESILGGWGEGEGEGRDDEDSADSKSAMDDLDLLLTQAGSPPEPNNNLAELKPLPPFTGYTGHLSINGISGHHYHAIAAAPGSPRLEPNNNSSEAANQNPMYYADQVVSSSTVDCSLDNIKTEPVDYNSLLAPDIEDIAAIIGSAIADTTVPGNNSNGGGSNGEPSREEWMDLEEWIDTACGAAGAKESGLPELGGFSLGGYSCVQIKRESPYMPLLQSRLQNGPPKDLPYGLEVASPSSSTPYLAHSPPSHVVSTSDLIRYNPVHSSTLPHTTTPSKKSKKKAKSAPASSTVLYTESGVGKEKPVHRCTICNRGFLNKSNIKVHLRTHTGEKPFRCEVCGKAFRQKAHLIKHAQIHKRIGRD